MRVFLKNSNTVTQKGNQHFKKKKIYAQQSMDFFAKNIVKELPFLSPHVTSKYNKYLLTKHRDKLLRIKNFLNYRISEKDDLAKAFEKLNHIRLKITIIERDINAYRTALMLSFDSKDSNMVLQKKIRHKYAKLRKYDAYQNLSLGIIYNKCIFDDKIKSFQAKATDTRDRIIAKHDSTTKLKQMQKDFIFSIIAGRQNVDKVFTENVTLPRLQSLLLQNPEYKTGLDNITTFTNYYLYKNPGSLSKDFVAFKASMADANINTIVKTYLNLYAKAHEDNDPVKLNNIQNQLFASFTYKDFKDSDVFGSMDRALSANDILLLAKTNFTKSEMCTELEYCLDLPEINNYFRIIEAKDRIKNYIVSTERLFVERIEKEFPDIKSTSFIYMYNKVKSTLEKYKEEIFNSELNLVRTFVGAVLNNEFDENKDNLETVLDNISEGIFAHPASIQAKKTLDTYCKLMTQFAYIKATNNIEFEQKLDNSKLFHGVLVTSKLQPILPMNIQSRIIKLPYEAQVSLSRNYTNSSILDLLDEFSITPNGELKLGDKIVSFGISSSSSIARLSMLSSMNKLEEYAYIAEDNKKLKNEYNLVQYIIAGISENIQDSTIATIIPNNNSMDMIEVTRTTKINETTDNQSSNDKDEVINEVVDYNKIRNYLQDINKDSDPKETSKKILAIQKRINSNALSLQSVQIDNLNEILNPIGLALRTPYDYVIHLVEKYKTEKRDLNSLQIGLKLRIRMGNLVLSDSEIDSINNDHNLELIQRVQPKIQKTKARLLQIYRLKGTVSDTTKDKLSHSDALIRNTVKKKSAKLSPLDMNLFRILNS